MKILNKEEFEELIKKAKSNAIANYIDDELKYISNNSELVQYCVDFLVEYNRYVEQFQNKLFSTLAFGQIINQDYYAKHLTFYHIVDNKLVPTNINEIYVIINKTREEVELFHMHNKSAFNNTLVFKFVDLINPNYAIEDIKNRIENAKQRLEKSIESRKDDIERYEHDICCLDAIKEKY